MGADKAQRSYDRRREALKKAHGKTRKRLAEYGGWLNYAVSHETLKGRKRYVQSLFRSPVKAYAISKGARKKRKTNFGQEVRAE